MALSLEVEQFFLLLLLGLGQQLSLLSHGLAVDNNDMLIIKFVFPL
jgi:hypothetical protein